MRTIELEQGSKEWLDFRMNKIGASDAPIIMGDSPWATSYKLWERKMGFAEEQKETHAMSEGKRLEEVARQTVEEVLHIPLYPLVGIHDEHDWMIASFDGFSIDGRAVEIKCVGLDDHLMAVLDKQVPKKYRYQLQHQLAVSGLDMIYYYSFDKACYKAEGRCQGALLEIKRDQKMLDEMIEKELTFMECIRKCVPPELSEKDFEFRNDNIWRFATANWKQAKEELTYAIETEKKMRQELIEESKSRNCKGGGVKVQRIMRSGLVDYSAIPALDGIDLDQYRKPASESWRITLDE